MKKKEAIKKGYVFCANGHWHANSDSARQCGKILPGTKKGRTRSGPWLYLTTDKPRRAPGCFEMGKRR
jgi:hypothetical protein